MSGPLTGQYRVGSQQTSYNQEYYALRHGASDSITSLDSLPGSSNTVKDIPRSINRTPSPTPSEVAALDPNGGGSLKDRFLKLSVQQRIVYATIGVVFLVLTILISVYTNQIVLFLQPAATKIHNLPAGWVIPIAILFVMSFPPLFGQEIVLTVVGLSWGFWAGIGIAAAGTYLGEVANFLAFKYFCTARGKKWQETKIDYACLAEIIRQGGLPVAIVARYSIIPPHYATAVFATCGMPFWMFTVSAIVSLPRQFVTVFIGVVLEDKSKGTETTADKVATYVALGVSIAATYGAVRYLKVLTQRVKPQVIYERRKARQAKLIGSLGDTSFSGSQSNLRLVPETESTAKYPLNQHTKWQPSIGGGYPPTYQDTYNAGTERV